MIKKLGFNKERIRDGGEINAENDYQSYQLLQAKQIEKNNAHAIFPYPPDPQSFPWKV